MEIAEAFKVRDKLSEEIYDEFGDSVNLYLESDKVAEWLIRTEWVKGARVENTN